MQPDFQETLKQSLRDIQLPQEVGLWPLAPAWWLLIGGLLLTFLIVFIMFRRYRSARLYRRSAIIALDEAYNQWAKDSDSGRYIQAANALLRRCMLHGQGQQSVAGVSGELWINALNKLTKQKLMVATQNALSSQCYQRAPEIDVAPIHKDIAAWIKNHQALKAVSKKHSNIVEVKSV